MMHLHQGRRERRGGSRLWWVYVGGCALALGAVLLALRVLAAVPAQSPPADGRTPQREATEQAILRQIAEMPPEQATAPTAPILTGVDMGARIRFLVLRVDAPGWDRAIVHGGAMGMLEAFAARSGFKIADAVEVVRPLELNDFPAGAGPPFLYMTGNGGIEVSDEELLALRDYCLRSGGMLIVDDGGGFGPAFERFMQRVFPGERLVTVAHDDPLFQFPYPLPNGADPLWHHSGTQLKGMRHDGRWALIYHPGDMASAWQPDHSGLSDKRAEVSYDLGVNLIYYAFTQYFQATRQDR